MILFAPEYDDQTRACVPVAVHLAGASSALLLRGQNAMRGPLLEALKSREHKCCMIFSHGGPDVILGQNDKDALFPDDMQNMPHKPVYAYACFSAFFGQNPHCRERVWWGYDKSMVPPPLDVLKRKDVEAIFRYVAHRFDSCGSITEVSSLVDEIRDQCQSYVARYRRDRIASMSSAVFFMQLWTRLRVWTPWSNQPFSHTESWRGDLDDVI